ncbi:MAG TPA: OB-fold domain-containing protein [Acidimicrobiales bacterium]|nr:OB-fold domain-containing protein [Acidimicrobiales bacterium]
MTAAKVRVPAQPGWFTLDPEAPALLGSRCDTCGTVAFPKENAFCRNPDCPGTTFEEVELSRQGRIWSFTDARYKPPDPYVATDPYEPFCIAAVELAAEQMVVLGQVVPGISAGELAIGTEMELVLDTLYEDDDHQYLVWKWAPVAASARTQAAGA